jgi:hypothetical protein
MMPRLVELTCNDIVISVRNDDAVLGVEIINNLHNEI